MKPQKTGNKWKTEKCGRCGKPHSGNCGFLDKNGIEFIVCNNTHKWMDVKGNDLKLYGHTIATVWTKEN
jgi:intracellular sulfur oxidation DsrE/DsrF family protein